MATIGAGNFFAGLADQLVGAKQAQEDLQYQRTTRQQEVESRDLQNKQRQMQVQDSQRQQDDAEAMRQAMRQAMQPAGDANASLYGDTSEIPQGAQPRDADPTKPPPGVQALGTVPTGPLSMDTLLAMDQERGLPIGTSYGIMKAESSGNPDAVSPVGAQGLFQVMPATAKDPGFGLTAFNPKDPNGAMNYFAAMYKKSGGDMSKALGYWNAGPAGNPNNPETKGFIPKVAKGAQEFQQLYQLRQQQQKPSAETLVSAAKEQGVTPSVSMFDSAIQSQQQQINVAMRTAQQLEQSGRPDLAQKFRTQAMELQTGQVKLQKQAMDTQKEANAESAQLASAVNDQSSYNGFLSQLKTNPAMAATVKGLNLTGDYNQDRNKVDTIAQRSITLKQQADVKARQAEIALKQQEEQRKQEKIESAKLAPARADAETQARAQVNKQAGIPTVETPVELYSDPVTARQAQAKISAANTKQLKEDTQLQSALSPMLNSLAAMKNLLVKGTPTGDIMSVGADLAGNGVVGKALFSTLTADQQLLNKYSNSLILGIQSLARAQGGGISSQTAAMSRIIGTTKPGISLKDNYPLIQELGAYMTDASAMLQFTDEFSKANPTVDRNKAKSEWQNYRFAVPLFKYGEPNPEADPTSKEYIDYHDWFRTHRYRQ